MSRRNRRNHQSLERLIDAAVARRLAASSSLALPPPAPPPSPTQDALMQQMTAQQAPAKQGTPMFAPGAPLTPNQGLVNPWGPRGYSFPVGYNIAAQPRSTEGTSFDTLRNLAALYDGIQLCEQVWLDTVAKLTLKIQPRPEIAAEQGTSSSDSKYSDKIRFYSDFFAMPDIGNGYDLKSWLRAAVRDQLQIDAVAIYVRRNRAGGVYSLELVDGSTIKPLIDPRGRRPVPPYPAYQQFLYGTPAGLYTSEELLYQRETTRTESIYGLSRIERIIIRINQALRKENKDLARFTDGNVPPGILEPPDDGSQWTPETLLAYQEMWDALLAGNDQARSRVKIVQPGSKFSTLNDPDIYVDFDRFLLNVTAACYSMTMADLGFTENVNKSSGESQENVFYRRAVQPLMDRYAQLFTYILRHYFGENDLIVTWSGFEESEDFNAMAASYVALTNAGITSPTTAAHLMNLPWSGPEIPNYVMSKDGPIFLEDAADSAIRQAQQGAKLAGLQFTQQHPGGPPQPTNDDQATQSNGKQRTPQKTSSAAQSSSDDQEDDQRYITDDISRAAKPAWRAPSQTQTHLESQLAKAIKEFIDTSHITKHGVELPDEAAHQQLLDALSEALEAAIREGQRIATGIEQRSLISAAKNLAGRAVQLVSRIIEQIQAQVAEIIADLFGDEGVSNAYADVAQNELEEWSEYYSELVAQTEVHSAIEEAIADVMKEQGATLMSWVTDSDPCKVCVENAEASPLPVGAAWPSGDECPPAHPRCKCTTAYS